ncbi:hypothetical protein [Halopseudomonas bauzanensis]|nr:hypothetical protein [Halopseudomonas bauzanensis]
MSIILFSTSEVERRITAEAADEASIDRAADKIDPKDQQKFR